jgi:hypothetical protein
MKFYGSALTRSSDSSQAFSPSYASIAFVIDGGGSVIAAGQQVDLPDLPGGATIVGWTVTTDTSASCSVDILRATYANFPGSIASIAGTDKPSTSAAQKNQDTALSGWGSTALVQGDCLRASVSSNDNAKRITVTLRIVWS